MLIVSSGCIVEGRAENSILSPGVVVEKDAQVIDSIVFHSTIIKKKSIIRKAIIDKNVKIGSNVKIGFGASKPNKTLGMNLATGITVIGKNAVIPDNMVIGKNCIIPSGFNLFHLDSKQIISGVTLGQITDTT